MIEMGTAIVVCYIGFALILLKLLYENGKLKKLVKQKDEEIEHMKRAQRICGEY